MSYIPPLITVLLAACGSGKDDAEISGMGMDDLGTDGSCPSTQYGEAYLSGDFSEEDAFDGFMEGYVDDMSEEPRCFTSEEGVFFDTTTPRSEDHFLLDDGEVQIDSAHVQNEGLIATDDRISKIFSIRGYDIDEPDLQSQYVKCYQRFGEYDLPLDFFYDNQNCLTNDDEG